jgi:hypothetical protein
MAPDTVLAITVTEEDPVASISRLARADDPLVLSSAS